MILPKVGGHAVLVDHDTDSRTGDMHNRMGITPGRLIAALGDYDLWPVSLDISLCKLETDIFL